MTPPVPNLLRSSDAWGILNSALCLVHCMAMPVLIALGAGFLEHPSITWAFIVLAFLAVRSAVRRKGNTPVAVLLGIAWALFAVGLALESLCAPMEHIAYLGSGLLIVGHLLNWLDLRPTLDRTLTLTNNQHAHETRPQTPHPGLARNGRNDHRMQEGQG